MISAHADSEHRGTGAINREEKIELTVAAVIVDRLPNGNLVLAGRQEVRINGELRELTVSGIIRPEDVTSDNTHQSHANRRSAHFVRRARLDQRRAAPNWGQRLGDAITPW
jgi:flagellar L-ring protein precursor FlgH